MSRRVLLIEPDPSGRALMDRVLAGSGYAVDAVASVDAAPELFGRGPPIELAILEAIGESGAVLDDVRAMRREHPAIPLVVTGALLSPRVLRELLRLRVVDALPKPFTPDELREAVGRAIELTADRHDDALEYAAATDRARRAIAEGRLPEAAPAVRRALAVAPLDAEAMALAALSAELEGRDVEAGRAYRAAIALHDVEDTPPPDPYEGLARLDAYEGARPVDALPPSRADAPLWIVSKPATELSAPSPAGDAPCVAVLSLGVGGAGPGATFYRDGPGKRAFALLAGAMRAEHLATAIAGIGAGPIVASEATRAKLDLAAIEELRSTVTPGRRP